MAAEKSFKAKYETGMIAIPFDVKEHFGKARPPVRVTINGYTYRSTPCVYGGKYFIPVRKSNQQAAGIKPEEIVSVTIAADTEVREVEAPPDLKAALAGWTEDARLARSDRAWQTFLRKPARPSGSAR